MIRIRSIAIAALTFLATLAVAVPLSAGTTKLSVKKLGKAQVKWNGVPFRQELMEQLSPGLTWRMGSGNPTRLELSGMALVGKGGMLLPGELTLNLRFWAQDNWQLVTFVDNNWKWSEESQERGIFPFEVGQERDEKKHTKQLEMTLRQVARKDGMVIFRPAVTGEAATPDEYTPEGLLSEAAQKQIDEAPVVEFEVRFGPHVGVARFEPVKFDTVKSTVKGSTSRDSLEIAYPRYTDLLARTEECNAEGALMIGLLTRDGEVEKTVVLELIGGDEPSLWPTTRKGAEELDFISGKRIVTKTSPKTMTVELDGKTLTVHLAKVDYVFEL